MSRTIVLKGFLGESVLVWTLNMRFVNKDVYLKKLLRRFQRCELQGVSSPSALMKLPESASPQPDLLEFTAGSDISIVIKQEI